VWIRVRLAAAVGPFDRISALSKGVSALLSQAFDMACALLGRTPQPTAVREAIAKCIIEAAKVGERDPVRLREAGLAALSNSNAA
jgi:hypothetical protein